MAKKVCRDTIFYAFDATIPPIYYAEQGEDVTLETHDCFEGQLQSEGQLLSAVDWERINPATGPVYINGVKPGDVLRVDLLDIKVAEQAVALAIPEEGPLSELVSESETAVLKIDGGLAVFKDRIQIPIKPMVGVIGVAPKQGRIANGSPGTHGGNMDCALIVAGTRLYLTAEVEGALFGAGDMHAVMGDGEISGTGAEIAGELTFRAKSVPMGGLPTPFLENEDQVATIASAKTLDEAAKMATANMALFLTRFANIEVNDAAMLMSLAGHLRVCQIVDPLLTMRFEFPKWILSEYGYQLPE